MSIELFCGLCGLIYFLAHLAPNCGPAELASGIAISLLYVLIIFCGYRLYKFIFSYYWLHITIAALQVFQFAIGDYVYKLRLGFFVLFGMSSRSFSDMGFTFGFSISEMFFGWQNPAVNFQFQVNPIMLVYLFLLCRFMKVANGRI